jgi:hypothetical protein
MSDRSDVPELLRAAADAHQPDRERMLARVEQGARRPRPVAGRWSTFGRFSRLGRFSRFSRSGRFDGVPGWARVAGAAAMLVATLGGAMVAVAWTAGPQGPAETPAGGGEQTGRRTDPPAPAIVRTTSEVDKGSNPYWSQSEVAVTTEGRLTSFTVEVHIARAGEVEATGAWRTLPDRDFELTVEPDGGELVFRWELRENAEIPPGEHIFAGQYDHGAGPRDAADDWYRVHGAGPGGEVSARGHIG